MKLADFNIEMIMEMSYEDVRRDLEGNTEKRFVGTTKSRMILLYYILSYQSKKILESHKPAFNSVMLPTNQEPTCQVFIYVGWFSIHS